VLPEKRGTAWLTHPLLKREPLYPQSIYDPQAAKLNNSPAVRFGY